MSAKEQYFRRLAELRYFGEPDDYKIRQVCIELGPRLRFDVLAMAPAKEVQPMFQYPLTEQEKLRLL